MEKISCDVIGDLLPLYCDEVCSEDSRKIIESHLQDCPDCSRLLQKMKTEYKLAGGAEQKQEEMVKNMAAMWRRSVKKSFCRGVLITLCACLLLAGGYWTLTRLVLVPVPLDRTRATVENVSGEAVELSLKVTDGKKVLASSIEVTEDGKCFIILKRGLIPQSNGGGEDWTDEWNISKTRLTGSGDSIYIREIYCGTENSNFLIWKAE